MKRRLFHRFALLVVAGIVSTAIATSLIFYSNYKERHEGELEKMLRLLVDSGEDFSLYDEVKRAFPSMRLTLIKPTGEVLYDTDRGPESMHDHRDRKEFREALETGKGTALRMSDTIGEFYSYHAQKLPTGNILRISEMQSNIYRSFLDVLWPILLISLLFLIIIGYIAHRFANATVDGLKRQIGMLQNSELPAEGEIDRELYPVRRLLSDQREDIHHKLDQLEEYRQTVEAILANMGEGLIFVDDVQRIVFMNHQALDFFGLDHAERDGLVGKSVFYLSRDPVLMDALSPGRAYVSEVVELAIHARTIRIRLTPVHGKGTAVGKVLTLRDVTEENSLERERREFTSNVTHELRTPLTSIQGYAELLFAGRVGREDLPRIGRIIHEEGDRLLSLIDSVMRLTKVEDCDEIRGKGTPFSVRELIASAVDLHQIAAEKRHLKITTSLEDVHYQGNRTLLEEVVHNLIDNACKYNVENGAIDIALVSTGRGFQLSVSDTGIGIALAEQEKIFQRFYTVDPSRHTKGASGIGLAIVKHAVQKMHGKIRVVSEPGKGSTFIVEIPYV